MDISGIHKTIVTETTKLREAYEEISPGAPFTLEMNYHFEDEVDKVYSVLVDTIIGQGGSKKALDIGNGQVLMLPSNFGDTAEYPNLWESLVKDETAYSKYTSQSGLLSVNSRMVKVWLDSPMQKINAYISDSFTSFASKQIFIIDPKVPEASTWNQNIEAKTCPSPSTTRMRKLFSSTEQLFNIDNWLPLLSGECIRDFGRLQKAGLGLVGDSVSIAVYTNKDLVPKQIRPIFFDFRYEWQVLVNVETLAPLKKDLVHCLITAFIGELVISELKAHNLISEEETPLSNQNRELISSIAETCQKLFDEASEEIETPQVREEISITDSKDELVEDREASLKSAKISVTTPQEVVTASLCTRVWNALVAFLSWIFCCGSPSTAGEQEA